MLTICLYLVSFYFKTVTVSFSHVVWVFCHSGMACPEAIGGREFPYMDGNCVSSYRWLIMVYLSAWVQECY